MPKLDAKKLLKDAYSATARPKLVEIPPLTYFMFDGHGDPNSSPDFALATEMLYTLSYTLKFALKQADPEQDYSVMPLEGLWWAKDPQDFVTGNKDKWRWTLMIMQPPRITDERFGEAKAAAGKKKALPFDQIQLAKLEEGLCAQVMHVGPFSEEGPAVAGMMAFIGEQGYVPFGKHHEIYLSDPRRVPEEKWKTILRHPCRPEAVGGAGY